MRIVRFVESWFEKYAYEEGMLQWGMLVDDLVFPLEGAPYLPRPWHNGVDAPKIDGDALALAELKLLPPVTPTKIVCVGRNYAPMPPNWATMSRQSRSSFSNRLHPSLGRMMRWSTQPSAHGWSTRPNWPWSSASAVATWMRPLPPP